MFEITYIYEWNIPGPAIWGGLKPGGATGCGGGGPPGVKGAVIRANDIFWGKVHHCLKLFVSFLTNILYF